MPSESLELFQLLVRVETDLWNRLDRRLRVDDAVGLALFEPMKVIATTPRCRVNDVATALGITVGGVSRLVDRIEREGWCCRLPHPEDGRSSVVELTEDGQRKLGEATLTAINELDELFGQILTTGELRCLEGVLRRLPGAPSTLDSSEGEPRR